MRKKIVKIVIICVFIIDCISCSTKTTPSLSNWSKLQVGMTQAEVEKVVGKPRGAINIDNTHFFNESTLTQEVKNSLHFSIWSYNQNNDLETPDGKLKDKALKFDANGRLIEIGQN